MHLPHPVAASKESGRTEPSRRILQRAWQTPRGCRRVGPPSGGWRTQTMRRLRCPAVPALLLALSASAQVPLPAEPPLPLPRLTSAPDPTLGRPAEAVDGGVDGLTPVLES